ncbi:hypothetical protein [Streptomyces lichenis]|uniref:Uncharacterized protein n=1 Tax=Streptomyces lichenis TaxID=2306967 RepID=A0ABT0II39_9ACTN|nr:hypothetical protein [Streptomyces lichenis]MCK8680971.1 hypothetical protein [Streptomyces lichenis]
MADVVPVEAGEGFHDPGGRGYFDSKDGLFDAVVTDSLDRIATVLLIDADDLARLGGPALRLLSERPGHRPPGSG